MTPKLNLFAASGPVILEKINGQLCALLNKHKVTNKKPNPKWQFCGGRVENFDQTLEAVAKREFNEEMGATVEIGQLIDVTIIKTEEKRTGILIHYLSKRLGEIIPGKEIAEWKWFPVNKLPKDCASNVNPVINKALKLIK